MLNVEHIIPTIGSPYINYQCHNAYKQQVLDYNCLYMQIPKSTVHQNIIMQTICNYGFRLIGHNIDIKTTPITRLTQNSRGQGVVIDKLINGRTWHQFAFDVVNTLAAYPFIQSSHFLEDKKEQLGIKSYEVFKNVVNWKGFLLFECQSYAIMNVEIVQNTNSITSVNIEFVYRNKAYSIVFGLCVVDSCGFVIPKIITIYRVK